MRDVAQAAEGLGFHSIWVPEHVVFFEEYESRYPYPPSPGSTETPSLPAGERPGLYDPLFACGAIAAATTTLRVGTAVALVPLRHPLLLAREVTSLDHFTGGRFTLGVGVGWLAEEFAALNVPFAERGAVADEHLDALARADGRRGRLVPRHARQLRRRGDAADAADAGWAADPRRRQRRRRTAPRRPLRRRLVRLEPHARRVRTRAGERLAAQRALDDLELQVGVRFGGPLDELAMLVERLRRARRHPRDRHRGGATVTARRRLTGWPGPCDVHAAGRLARPWSRPVRDATPTVAGHRAQHGSASCQRSEAVTCRGVHAAPRQGVSHSVDLLTLRGRYVSRWLT